MKKTIENISQDINRNLNPSQRKAGLIFGGVLLGSMAADGISYLISGQRISDYMSSETTKILYEGFTKKIPLGMELILGLKYLSNKFNFKYF